MINHEAAVESLKVMIKAAKADDPVSHYALEDILKYIEQFKPRPKHCRKMTIEESWSRLNLIIEEPQIPLTSGDVEALTTLREHMLAEKNRLVEQGQKLLKMADEAIEVRERLETKAQDLLREIYRL